MPIGWYVIDPPDVGVLASTSKKVQASLNGNLPVSGTILPTAPKLAAALAGNVGPAGGINATSKKVAASLTGEHSQSGTSASTLQKVTAALASTFGNAGAIVSQLQKTQATLSGLNFNAATIASTLQKTSAALVGEQDQVGTIASTLKKATAAALGSGAGGPINATLQKASAALAGQQAQVGTIDSTLQKISAALAGEQAQVGTIASALKKTQAALAGDIGPTGGIASTLQKTTAALSGAQTFGGTMGATLKKVSAALVGNQNDFVTRDADSGALLLNGTRYRCAGANCVRDIGIADPANGNAYGATVVSGLYMTPHSQIDAILDSAELMNASVIRNFAAMAFNHPLAIETSLGVFNSTNIDALDYALYQCGQRNIRMILPLLDEVGSHQQSWVNLVLGSGAANLFYTNSSVITAFKAHVSYVLDHVNTYTGVALKNDPAVLCWETGNELTSLGLSIATYATWIDTISQYIKVTKGAQQLVMDGTTGTTGDWLSFYNDIFELQYVDIYSDHSYDNFRTPTNIEIEAKAAHTFGKAFIMGEATWTDRAVSGSVLSWTLTNSISKIDASPFVDGDLYWELNAPGTNWGGGFNLHRPATGGNTIPTFGAMPILDEDGRGDQLAAHATVMAGAAPALPAKTETLVDTFTSAAQWDLSGVATVTGGQASIATPTSSEQALSSKLKYDLTNSYIIIEMPTMNPGTGSCMCGVYVQDGQAPYGGSVMGFFINGSTINYRYRFNGTDSDQTEASSASNNRWLRLRADIHSGAANGTAYWDISSDGKSWVNKRTLSAPAQLINSVNIIIFNWNFGSDVTSGTAKFDNLNNPPAPVPSLYPPVRRPNYGSLLQV